MDELSNRMAQEMTKAHDRIKRRLGNRLSEEKAKKMSNFLTSLFYPKDDKSKATFKLILKEIQSLYEMKIEEGIEDMKQLSTYMANQRADKIPTESFIEEKKKVLRKRLDDYKRGKTITKGLLEDRVARMETYAAAMGSENEELVRDVKTAVEILKDFLKKYVGYQSNEKIQLVDDKTGEEVLENFYKIEDLYFNISQYNAGVEEIGLINEIMLYYGEALFYQEKKRTEVDTIKAVTDLLKEMQEKNNINNTNGKKKITTAGDFFVTSKVTVNKNNKTTQQIVDQYLTKEMQAGLSAKEILPGLKIETSSTSYNPGNAHRAKVDILFKLNDNNEENPSANFLDKINKKIRSSAKSWYDVDKEKGFNPTYLSYALNRTYLNENNVYLYAESVSKKEEPNILSQAHIFARFALYVDSLIGYAQKTGYADVLIINIRSRQRVTVVPLQALTEYIFSNETRRNNFLVSDYDSEKDKISSTISNIYNYKHDHLFLKQNDKNQLARNYLSTLSFNLKYYDIKNSIKEVTKSI